MRKITCIVCPRGCEIQIDDNSNISGNGCQRGSEYAVSEITNPVRVVTSTVSCSDGTRCPVRTSGPVPKDRMLDVMREIHKIQLDKKIKMGDTIFENICSLDVALISSSESQ